MKYTFILGITLVSSLSFAKTQMSKDCQEKASNAIIELLQSDEPRSEVHIVKDDKGRIIGLTDANEIYAEFDLQSIRPSRKGTVETILFNEGDFIVYADVQVRSEQGQKVCNILDVQTGQDDQD